jgi:hypothetical protein
MLRCFLVATVVLLAAATMSWAEPSSPPPPAVESPDMVEPMQEVQLGDHWTYELKDEISGEIKATTTNVVTDVSASEVSTRTGITGKFETGYMNFDRSWNVTSNVNWKFAPNDGSGMSLPLAVGKTWSFKGTEVNTGSGYSGKRSGTSKVVAQESMTTRAGTFDTFKVETAYLEQGTNDPTRKYQVLYTTWYAPVINHWVKRISISRVNGKVRDNSSLELVEYGRR